MKFSAIDCPATIRLTLDWLPVFLSENPLSRPVKEAKQLLCHYMEISPTQLPLHLDSTLCQGRKEVFLKHLEQLRNGTPLAYLLGTQGFYKYDFLVNKHVLIPRPETELVLEEAIKQAAMINNDQKYILDIGTGSGVIALCLAKHFPQSEILAIDCSQDAIAIAEKNRKVLKANNCRFALHNVFKMPQPLRPFDLIVSNPPYIDNANQNVHTVRRHEPHLALFAENQGLAFFKFFAATLKTWLKPNGVIVSEIGYDQRLQIKEIFYQRKWQSVIFGKDYAGHDRFFTASP